MRDFRDAKAMARDLRTALNARGLRLSQAEALELTARMLGARDWNTLSAAIDAAGKPAPATSEAPAAPADVTPPESPLARNPVLQASMRGGPTTFSKTLEGSLHRAIAAAQGKSYATLEHLLLVLTDDADARLVLEACQVDIGALTANLEGWLADVKLPPLAPDRPTAPTAGFHRVIQRAVIHVQSSGRDEVTGANVLVAIFSERESHACAFLEAQNMTRYDAVDFIAHGVRKDGGRAA
jgi:hypothetical protein